MAGRGKARQGEAGQGMAGHGTARQGEVISSAQGRVCTDNPTEMLDARGFGSRRAAVKRAVRTGHWNATTGAARLTRGMSVTK